MTLPNLDDTSFVFVGGVSRSGTSLVQKILDLHPQIYAGPELQILNDLMSTYDSLSSNISSGKLTMLLDRQGLKDSYRSFFHSLYADRQYNSPPHTISEKTPNNILCFETLAEVFPDARFVWIIRDPRDVLCSFRDVYKRSRQKGQGEVGYGKSLYRDLEYMRQYLASGTSFAAKHPNRLHIIYYEELVTDPAPHITDLTDFLEVAFQSQMLETDNPNDTSRAITNKDKTYGIYYDKSSFDRPIDDSSVGKWKQRLGLWPLRAIDTYLSELDCLDRYDLQKPSWPWRVSIPMADKTVTLTRKALRHLTLSG